MAESLTLYLTKTADQGSPKVPLTIEKNVSAKGLREKVSEATKIPKESLKMIFRGRMISDDEKKEAVAEYKLEDGSVIHCMGKPVKSDANASNGSAPVSTPESSTTAAAPPAAFLPTPAAAAAATASTPTDPLQAALQQLRASNSPSVYQTAVTTLAKVISNVTDHPMEEKYRKVKKQNAAFQRRLGGLPGGDASMKACGFVIETSDGQESYVIQATAEAWPKLMANKKAVEAAVRDATATVNQASAPPAASFGTTGSAGNNGFPGGMPGMTGGMGGIPPGMNQAFSDVMSNPAQLQAMLQNPMVQQMMRNDPRFANNPGMLESLQQFANNPALLSQMMNAPGFQQQMQAMMTAQGGGTTNPALQQQMQAMMAAQAGNPPSATGGGRPPQQASANSGSDANDDQQTEEEMIAEAIRRSLEDSS